MNFLSHLCKSEKKFTRDEINVSLTASNCQSFVHQVFIIMDLICFISCGLCSSFLLSLITMTVHLIFTPVCLLVCYHCTLKLLVSSGHVRYCLCVDTLSR